LERPEEGRQKVFIGDSLKGESRSFDGRSSERPGKKKKKKAEKKENESLVTQYILKARVKNPRAPAADARKLCRLPEPGKSKKAKPGGKNGG